MQLLQEHQINILTEVIYIQMLPLFKKEVEEFEEKILNDILKHLRFSIAGRLALYTIAEYDIVVAKVKEDIDPNFIIADIIL